MSDAAAGDRDQLARMGATIAPVDITDAGPVAAALHGRRARGVGPNALREAIVDRQGGLLDAV